MKKNIFIILLSILLILILFYFYDEREEVLNKRYSTNNIYVEYPFFNNNRVDYYINSYIDRYTSNNYDYMFIDYDYYSNNRDIYLTMYMYGDFNNMVSMDSSYFVINSDNINRISNRDLDVNMSYDNYSGKTNSFIALTFDDGPNYNTDKVLDILEKYGVKATFFVLGCNIDGNERIIERMNNMGMEIGNHMYSHKLVSRLSDEEIRKEIKKVDDKIFSIIGKKPTLIRPSYGSYNKRLVGLVNRPIVVWNIDTLDWKYHNSRRIANRVIGKVSNGDIVLMHDIYSATKNSLDIIIPKLLSDGYKFVTVSELKKYN